MAGARDVRRAAAQRRREQAIRNAQAVAEAEARRMESKDKAGMTPGERRLLMSRRARMGNNQAQVIREGHRIQYVDGLDAIPFASNQARKKARQFELAAADFATASPTGTGGKWTTEDVVALMQRIEAQAERDQAALGQTGTAPDGTPTVDPTGSTSDPAPTGTANGPQAGEDDGTGGPEASQDPKGGDDGQGPQGGSEDAQPKKKQDKSKTSDKMDRRSGVTVGKGVGTK